MPAAISVVVVAYRQREALLESLDAAIVAAERLDGGAELIVVDNGGLADLVRARFPAAHVIEPGRNVGFSGGAARGIDKASAPWVALINDDARIQADALVKALTAGARDPRIGSVATQVRFYADPQRINSAGIEVDSLGVASERLAGRPIEEAEEPLEVFGPSACFGLYRAEMLAQVGNFDERFFAYQEDVDLAWRAQAAGWSCVYEPQAVALHHASSSTGEGSSRKYFLVGRNRARLLARNATTAQLLRTMPLLASYDIAYVVYVALTDRTLAPLHGRLAGVREWRSLRRESRGRRRPVELASPWRGWLNALRQHRAYRSLGTRA